MIFWGHFLTTSFLGNQSVKLDILSGQRKSYTHRPSVLWVFLFLFCMFSLSPPSLSAAVVLNRHHGIYSCPKKRRKKRRKKNFQRRRYAALRLQWQVVKVKKKKKKKNQLTLKTWSWRKLPLALGRWRLKKLLHNLQQGSRPLCKRRPKLLWQRHLTLTVTFAGSS